jgi:hypothetical protein
LYNFISSERLPIIKVTFFLELHVVNTMSISTVVETTYWTMVYELVVVLFMFLALCQHIFEHFVSDIRDCFLANN